MALDEQSAEGPAVSRLDSVSDRAAADLHGLRLLAGRMLPSGALAARMMTVQVRVGLSAASMLRWRFPLPVPEPRRIRLGRGNCRPAGCGSRRRRTTRQ